MKNGKKSLIGILLLTLFLVNMTAPASAYVYNGAYWYNGIAPVQKGTSIPSSWSTALTAAANTWNNVGTNFYFSWMITNNKLNYAPLLPNTTIASTYPDPSGDKMIGCTVTFNKNLVWSTSGESGKFDVQNIATHEFGHWLRLGHSSETEATMYKNSATGETKKQTLHTDDIQGIRSIYD